MTEIKCPHCGYWQEPYREIILCQRCYADIKEVIDEHFKGKVEGERPHEPKSDFRRGEWSVLHKQSIGTHSRFSGPLVILKRTLEASVKRFLTLYPLIYLSFLFFLLIGIFTSRIGAHIVYKMPEFAGPLDNSYNLTTSIAGIVACLFMFFYGQAAFIIAVSNEGIGMITAFAKAWRRIGAYIVLMLLMAAVIGAGFMLFLIPGVVLIVYLAFTPFIFSAEDAGLTSSFIKSFRYVSKSWLPVFFRLAPVSIAVILVTSFFAYVGGGLLWATQNVYIFVFVISALMSLPILFLAVLIFKIYEDVRTANGFVPVVEVSALFSPKERKPVSVSTDLSPFEELLSSSWGLYRKRFMPLSILNIISYLPHIMHLLLLLAGYLGLKTFLETLEIKGDFGLIALMILPKEIIALLIVGVLVYLLLYVLSAIFNVGLYLALELAIVYVIADETIGARGALRKAWKRVGRYFWTRLYRDFIVSTGFMLFIPGVVFWVWYEFTPYVFALEREEQTSLASLLKSREYVRGLWGPVFKELISLKFLPLVIVAIFILFVFAGLPFYWMSGLFLSFFSGLHLPGMLTIYSRYFWDSVLVAFYILVGGFYLAYQKVFLYLLYLELKNRKADNSVGS